MWRPFLFPEFYSMSKQAKNTPVFTSTEVDTRGMDLPEGASVVTTNDASVDDLRSALQSAPAEGEGNILSAGSMIDMNVGGKVYRVTQKYLDELKFNEDMLTIVIHETEDENAEFLIPVGNNGVPQSILRGQEIQVKRKFVEVLAHAKAVKIKTPEFVDNTGGRSIRIDKTSAHRYPFSVIFDPAGAKGQAWLKARMAEG